MSAFSNIDTHKYHPQSDIVPVFIMRNKRHGLIPPLTLMQCLFHPKEFHASGGVSVETESNVYATSQQLPENFTEIQIF